MPRYAVWKKVANGSRHSFLEFVGIFILQAFFIIIYECETNNGTEEFLEIGTYLKGSIDF